MAIALLPATLRPLVNTGKVRFEAGAKTRQILMSIFFTLQQRFPDFPTRFKNALGPLAENHIFDPYNLPFQQAPSQAVINQGLQKSPVIVHAYITNPKQPHNFPHPNGLPTHRRCEACGWDIIILAALNSVL